MVWTKKQTKRSETAPFCIGLLVPLVGVEPTRTFGSRDFKSLASAYSAITAKIGGTTRIRTGE